MLLTLSLSNINCNNSHCNSLSCPNYNHKLPPATTTTSAVSIFPSTRQLLIPVLAVSSSVANGSSSGKQRSLPNPNPIHYVCLDESGGGGDLVSSAMAVASAIRKASTSQVEFEQRIDKGGKSKGGLVLPSPEFQRLCREQLVLFRRIVHPDAHLSVFVRPAGSYVMDQLELHRVAVYPTENDTDIVILFSNFRISTGLRATEASISNQHAEFVPECSAVVFPMVKPPFVVGFLVAELPKMEPQEREETCAFPPSWDTKPWEIQSYRENQMATYKFTADQKLNAINISRSLAMAYVMDQKAMFLQQSSWQNNIRMSSLVEQIRGPLASIRTLSKMLSLHMKRSEISYDIVEDILVQGDHMIDTLQQLQDAVYLTKANIVRYNEETLTKMHGSSHAQPQSVRSHLSSISRDNAKSYSATSISKDLELPMPPLALAPLQKGVRRPCDVSDLLEDLVGAIEPLALKQQRIVELCELSQNLQVAVEEPALRQALSNLIEGALLRTHVGGKVDIMSTEAPAGGALVIIDDDGPDMHYMTQMHSLAPFGVDLFSKDMVEDNMTWNFVAGMTVAREILESYGCVVRVISPCRTDATLGAGGTRIELWLPSSSDGPDREGPAQEA